MDFLDPRRAALLEPPRSQRTARTRAGREPAVSGPRSRPRCAPSRPVRRLAARAGARAARAALAGGATVALARTAKPPRIHHVFVIVLENEGYGADLRRSRRRPLPRADASRAGGAAGELLRHRSREQRQLHLARLRTAAERRRTRATASCSTTSPARDARKAASRPGAAASTRREVAEHRHPALRPARAGRPTWRTWATTPTARRPPAGTRRSEGVDETQKAEAGDGYATRHDPFVYFHSVIDEQAYCDKHVVALGTPSGAMPAAALHDETGLATDLASAGRTPKLLVHHPQPLQRRPRLSLHQPAERRLRARRHRHLPGNVGAADHRLSRLPQRRAARDRLRRGRQLRNRSVLRRDSRGPNSPLPGVTGPGGGRVGALLLSPLIKPGTVSTVPYNHYSSLASWETLLRAAPAGRRRDRHEHLRRRRVHGRPPLAGPALRAAAR